jgi:hypothetical protein
VIRLATQSGKSLTVKVELVEHLITAVSAIFTATQFAQQGATTQTEDDFDEAYRAWQHEKAILTALLAAYFRSGEVDQRWLRCRTLATAYYVQSGIPDNTKEK